MMPPKPPARPRRVSLWRYFRMFRDDILSAQPGHLYDARMAEFRTPFFRSYLINESDLIRQVLSGDPGNFPKSTRVTEGLRPLLGNAVFVTNGETWARQRRIIDPAFEAARLPLAFPALTEAAKAAAARLAPGEFDAEAWAAHGAADAIFRVLFSVPIGDALAAEVYAAFRAYQRAQPILNLGAFVPLPRWMPRFHRRATRKAAARIRRAISAMVDRRAEEIAEGTAPDDLSTRLMTMADPETGRTFDTAEMTDQVAIFFLAGHETSASALAWALYLLATHPDWQARAGDEAKALGADPDLRAISAARALRDVFRETLRLYPPVPMMVRQARAPVTFRNRPVGAGAQVVISPWHLHRHHRRWPAPDAFDPGRFADPDQKDAVRDAFLPFSAGPRVCPGAGLAMIEGPLFLAAALRDFRFGPAGPTPVPVAHLTVRSRDGIRLTARPAPVSPSGNALPASAPDPDSST